MSNEKIVQAGYTAFDAWEMSCVTQADRVRADKVRHMVVVMEKTIAELERKYEELTAELDKYCAGNEPDYVAKVRNLAADAGATFLRRDAWVDINNRKFPVHIKEAVGIVLRRIKNWREGPGTVSPHIEDICDAESCLQVLQKHLWGGD